MRERRDWYVNKDGELVPVPGLVAHGEGDQKPHGNWAGWGGLGSPDDGFSAAEIAGLVSRRRGVQAGSGGPVGFVNKILRNGKAQWDKDLDVDDLIATNGKNVMHEGRKQGRAFSVESDEGFLNPEPHEIYQAYQRGMGDLMFEGAEKGEGYLAKVMNEKTPLFTEREQRGTSYFYEIPEDKSHVLRVATGQNRFGDKFIRTVWVEPAEGFPGGRVDDIDMYNQKYWDRYRSANGLPEQPYTLEAWYGDPVQPRRSGGGQGKYKDGFRRN